MRPTRNEITQELYNSKEIASAIKKMQPASIRQELKQEMFLSLCSITDEKFFNLYENGALKFWLVRCMLNMIRSTTMNQPFFRNFRAKFESLEGFDNLPNQEPDNKEEKEKLFSLIEENRKGLHWYEDQLLETWMDLGFNQREVYRKTKIPYMSIVKTISAIKLKLQDDTKRES
jgi:hypothetical protein